MPADRLDGEMNRGERDADQKGNQHTGLLRVFVDQENPSGQRQLALHFEEFPIQGVWFVVGPQQRGRTAERRRLAGGDRFAGSPKHHSIHDRHAYGPEEHGKNRIPPGVDVGS
eukprot:1057818-Prymnesium_polylepis.2